MIYQFFTNPTEKTIRTNILYSLIQDNSLKEIKLIISKLEKTDFDLTKESITFEGIEYGILRTI